MSTLVSKVAKGKLVNQAASAKKSRNDLIDNSLLIAVVALSLFGVVMIASASKWGWLVQLSCISSHCLIGKNTALI